MNANGISSPGSTYRPELSFLLDNLTSIGASAGIRVCYLPLGLPPCLVGVPLPFFGFSVSADAANLDFWDNGGGPLNVLGDPDYVTNDPWNLVSAAVQRGEPDRSVQLIDAGSWRPAGRPAAHGRRLHPGDASRVIPMKRRDPADTDTTTQRPRDNEKALISSGFSIGAPRFELGTSSPPD